MNLYKTLSFVFWVTGIFLILMGLTFVWVGLIVGGAICIYVAKGYDSDVAWENKNNSYMRTVQIRRGKK